MKVMYSKYMDEQGSGRKVSMVAVNFHSVNGLSQLIKLKKVWQLSRKALNITCQLKKTQKVSLKLDK